ncbi:conserved hypothetical protein [Histoplasma capsulatum G186AR]|uniref:Required for respiratory growth protein 9, mitochondrial n=1 Tax=Ajellomyces capsulatus (strain G186AR / H82 / ATCC MYA-2454 / RMSCC 2432) TaxID=447093 RepID=C0ND04_AJECG|nr:uncharacterized protein HCBG_01000 [Histoplasma capsulatum G186AR]EEH11545.1 conserved hypothetical protein [Histoplasma capsulatum G186AR]
MHHVLCPAKSIALKEVASFYYKFTDCKGVRGITIFVSMAKPTSLPSAFVISGLLRSFLGIRPLLPTTYYRKNSLTTSCQQFTTKIWQPASSHSFSNHFPILSQSSETPELSPSCSSATDQPHRTDERRPNSDRRDKNLNSKSTTKASPAILKHDSKSKIPCSSKSATQKRENSDNPRELEPWQIQKRALKKKFPEGWNPRKRLHPDTLDTIRHLHQQDPATYSTPALAQEYKVSPEAIRRILKSKWRPSPEIAAERRERWEKRHKRIWNQLSEIGVRPHRPSFADVSDTKVLGKKRRT